ncbi:MAG: PhzF family phenazine biosynthesis protein [Halanaerobium sp.]|nr:PhzF family phenazine biosynthesis protein [Halanaerobium sp.]
MKSPSFHIVDVFAEERYTGNQLAVCRDVEELSGNEMQLIAKEMNYSETTFILSEEERAGGYDVRIFTPEEELPFAGHPTLGTAYILQQEVIRKPVAEIKLNLPVGQIPVRLNYDEEGNPVVLWMRQKEPNFGRTFAADKIARVLHLEPAEIDNNYPIQEVSTGLPFIIVPVRTLRAVKEAKLDYDNYFRLIENTASKSLFAFCPETYLAENQLHARDFTAYYGVPEDPATGSANGCLAGYLVKYRYLSEDKIDITVEQGYEVKRPSLLYLQAEERDGRINVTVGGKVQKVAYGKFI